VKIGRNNKINVQEAHISIQGGGCKVEILYPNVRVCPPLTKIKETNFGSSKFFSKAM
jgi:hypothetical protein